MSTDGEIGARIYLSLIKRGILTLLEALNQLGREISSATNEDDAKLMNEIINRIKDVDPAVYGIERDHVS